MSEGSLVQLPAALLAEADRRGAPHLLGLDGGATKTLAAVLDVEAGTVHLAHGGPSNEDAVGAQAAVEALLGTAEEALRNAGISAADLGGAVLAVAGTDTAAIAAQVAARGRGDWIVVNDVVGAWATATAASPGVGAISGTGSNVFGVGRDGQTWRAGGWGHLLGDEGSGYWFGIQSIKAALSAREGSGPETGLAEAARVFFGVERVEQLGNIIYSRPLTKGEIAAFAREAAELARGGDAVACAIFRDGAAELSGQIAAVVARTQLEGSFPVGLIGSTWHAGSVFTDPLREAIAGFAPQAEVVTVEMAPVGGSLLLAAGVAGRREEIPVQRLSKLLDQALAA